MTYQEAEQELKNYEKLLDGVKALQRQRDEVKGRLYTIKTSSTSESVSGGEKNQALYNLLDKIEKIEKEMYEEEQDKRLDMFRIQGKVDRLSYPLCKVLRKYYIEFKTWEMVAVECDYSLRQVMYHRDNGIKEYAEIQNNL